MHDTYSEKSSAFDPHSHEVILASFDQRLHRGMVAKATPAPPEPQAAHGTHPKLVIGVTERGEHMVGGHALDDATLRALLAMSFKDDPATRVIIKPVAHAPRAALGMIFDGAKAAGLPEPTVELP